MKYPKLRELKEAIKSIFSKPATTKYPFAKPKIHPRFRGKPTFQDECIGCMGCKEICPSGAIEVIDDIENKKRKIVRHLDKCIMCGECERICTSEKGVKLLPEFDLAGFNREEMIDSLEMDLVLCENCKNPVATKKHILWLVDKLKEKGTAQLPFLIIKLKELGVVEDIERKVELDKRQDLFAVLCSKCRHKITIYDSR